MPKLSVIIPCYFNEDNISITVPELIADEANFPAGLTFEYVFVDDGSRYNTLQAPLRARTQYPDRVRVVELVGNVGSIEMRKR